MSFPQINYAKLADLLKDIIRLQEEIVQRLDESEIAITSRVPKEHEADALFD